MNTYDGDSVHFYTVDQWSRDYQCRYCYRDVEDGDRLYEMDDGDVCFCCLNKQCGPHCFCGKKVKEAGARCLECSKDPHGTKQAA